MAAGTFFTILNNTNIKALTANVILAKTRTYCFTPNTIKSNHLYARINAVGDPSCSVAPVLQQWVKEGRNANEFLLQRIIRDLRARRRYSHALAVASFYNPSRFGSGDYHPNKESTEKQVSKWMSNSGLEFSSSDCAVQLDLIGRVHGLTSANAFFSNMRDQEKTVKTYGALLNCYDREGLLDESLCLVKKMSEMGFLSSPLNYNKLTLLYTNTAQLEKVSDVLLEMKRNGVSPDKFSYSICINSYAARADINSMENVLQEMESRWHIQMDSVTYSTVANHYIKAGLREKALYFLKEWEKNVGKDALDYNHLISFYATLRKTDEMKRLWDLQRPKCRKHINREYITMMGSVVKLGELEELKNCLRSGSCLVRLIISDCQMFFLLDI
ncbi:hypothetical protein SCA6_018405, partial [Theobroma cacao]